MARLSKEESARYEGASWALKLVKERGIEQAQKELEWRGVDNCPLGLNEADRKRYAEKIYSTVYKSFLALAVQSLQDALDIDRNGVVKWAKVFEDKASCIVDDFVTWEEIEEAIAEETGIKVVDNKLIIE